MIEEMNNMDSISVENMQTPLLTVRDLGKKFDNLEVLKGVNIDIYKGDVVAVIGPSGCGKSTFLRCLNFLEMPNAGEISFENNVIFKNERVYLKREMKALKAQKGYNKNEYKAIEAAYRALYNKEKPIKKQLDKQINLCSIARLISLFAPRVYITQHACNAQCHLYLLRVSHT